MQYDKRRYVRIRDICPNCEEEFQSPHSVWSECLDCGWKGKKVKRKITRYKEPEIESEEII